MNISQCAIRIAIVVIVAVLPVVQAKPSQAALHAPANVVYSTADSGPGSLRDVIASVSPDEAVVFFLSPNSVITLTTGALTINKNLMLYGASAQNVTISGNDASRVISITAPVSVTLNGLTITRGWVGGDCDATFGAGAGVYAVGGELKVINSVIAGNNAGCDTSVGLYGDGGIASEGAVIIRNSVIENNNAGSTASGGVGGVTAQKRLELIDTVVRGNSGYSAVRAASDTRIERSRIISNASTGIDNAGNLTVTDSEISGNVETGIFNSGSATFNRTTIHANAAGGLFSTGQLALVNSTVSGNGGALFSIGALMLSGYAFIASSTIVSNTAGAINLPRSGLSIDGGSVELQNSIVASNGITNNFAISTSASLTSLGYNLTNSTDVLTATGDVTGTLPVLGPLQNNGGPTPTHALLPGSPGMDGANPAGCTGVGGALLTTDQRGYPREADGTDDGVRRCDIGAYEVWVPTHLHYLPFLPN